MPQTPTWSGRYLILTSWGIARPNYSSVQPSGGRESFQSASFACAPLDRGLSWHSLGRGWQPFKEEGCGQIPVWFCCARKDRSVCLGEERSRAAPVLRMCFCFLSLVTSCWFCNLLAAGKNIVFKGLSWARKKNEAKWKETTCSCWRDQHIQFITVAVRQRLKTRMCSWKAQIHVSQWRWLTECELLAHSSPFKVTLGEDNYPPQQKAALKMHISYTLALPELWDWPNLLFLILLTRITTA